MATTLGMNNPSDKELVKNAYNTQNQSGYSFGLINPTTGISFNTISPSLGTLDLNRGLGDIAAGVSIGPGSGYSKKIEANKVANKDVSKEDTSNTTEQAPGSKRMFVSAKKAQRLTDRGKATKVESEYNTDGTQLIERKKKKFMDTRFGQVLGSTPLGMATRAVIDTVKEGKARRAKKNNK